MAEKNMPAMPWFVKDYMIDTMHLTTEQHGAYMLLLGNAWNQGGSLPDNDHHLSSIARLSLEAWLAMKPVVMEFWTLKSGRWLQKRLSKELAYVAGRREALRAAGKKGGTARHGKQTEKEESQAKARPQASLEQGYKPGLSKKGSLAQAPTPTPTLTLKEPPNPLLTEHAEPLNGGGFLEDEGFAEPDPTVPGPDEDLTIGDLPEHKPVERWTLLGPELLEITGLDRSPRPVAYSIVRQWLADWTEADILAAVQDVIDGENYNPAAINNLKYFEPAIRRRVEQRAAELDSEINDRMALISDTVWAKIIARWRAGEVEWDAGYFGPAPDQRGFKGPTSLAGPRDIAPGPAPRRPSNVTSFPEAAARQA